MGPPKPHVPSRRKYHTSCGSTRAGGVAPAADSVAASWLIHNHPCYWFAVLFFFGSVDTMSTLIHGKAMYFVLDAKVFQLAEMIRIIFLENRNNAAVASHINALETGIVFNDVAAIRDGQRGNCSMFLKVDYDHQVVVFTNQERAAVFGVKCHAVIAFAWVDFINRRFDFVRCRIDH